MKVLPYIVCLVLVIVILLQRGCTPSPEPKIEYDTVIVYKIIRDTIPGETKWLRAKIDTSIWMKKSENIPSTNVDTLKDQYIALGNRFFAENTFSTPYSLGKYGSVTAIDTIRENKLVGSSLITNLIIPEKTITKTVENPPKRQLYIGGHLALAKSTPISGIYGGFLFKDKKERIYSLNLGWQGEPVILGGTYWKLGKK